MKTRLIASLAVSSTLLAGLPAAAYAAPGLWVQPLGAAPVRVRVQAVIVDTFFVYGKADTITPTIVRAHRVTAKVGQCTVSNAPAFRVVRCPVSLQRTDDGRGSYTLRLQVMSGSAKAHAVVTRQIVNNKQAPHPTPTPKPSTSVRPTATATPTRTST